MAVIPACNCVSSVDRTPKRYWVTKQGAKSAAKHQNAHNGGRPVMAYRCPQNRAVWHVGHPSPRRSVTP